MGDTSPRAHWPAEWQRAYEAGKASGCVGSTLVSETGRVRVWHLSIPPGGRCGFHRHVLNYFWTALSPGEARAYHEDGHMSDARYTAGQTEHLDFAAGASMVHALENIGRTELTFTTVEFLDSPNRALAVPDSVRLRA